VLVCSFKILFIEQASQSMGKNTMQNDNFVEYDMASGVLMVSQDTSLLRDTKTRVMLGQRTLATALATILTARNLRELYLKTTGAQVDTILLELQLHARTAIETLDVSCTHTPNALTQCVRNLPHLTDLGVHVNMFVDLSPL
jgi:hypothetical protein